MDSSNECKEKLIKNTKNQETKIHEDEYDEPECNCNLCYTMGRFFTVILYIIKIFYDIIYSK